MPPICVARVLLTRRNRCNIEAPGEPATICRGHDAGCTPFVLPVRAVSGNPAGADVLASPGTAGITVRVYNERVEATVPAPNTA